MKILIFGLSGSGKSYLAQELMDILGDRAEWFNADVIREQHDDWDFSYEGRRRQLGRMQDLSAEAIANDKIAICDFICPLETARAEFNADFEVFMDTIEECEYADTNRMFNRPDYGMYDCIIPNYCVKKKRGDEDARIIAAQIEEIIKST